MYFHHCAPFVHREALYVRLRLRLGRGCRSSWRKTPVYFELRSLMFLCRVESEDDETSTQDPQLDRVELSLEIQLNQKYLERAFVA